MALVQIEEYRGWDIRFNTEEAEFNAYHDNLDLGISKLSYAAAKKAVDDYIKDNGAFVPFEVEDIGHWKTRKRVKVVGIRKDNRFAIEHSDGTRDQMSGYQEKDWGIPNPANDEWLSEIDAVKLKIAALEANKKALESELVTVTLSEYRAKLGLPPTNK